MLFYSYLIREASRDDSSDTRTYFGTEAAGAIVYAKKDKKFLVLQRQKDTSNPKQKVKEPGTWSIVVSGKVDDTDGNSRNTAKREFKEELKFKGWYTLEDKPFNVFKDGDFKFTTYVIIVDTIFKPDLNWEHSDYKWISKLSEIPNPIHFGTKELLSKIKKRWF